MGKTGNRFSGSQKMSALLSICPYGVPENLLFLRVKKCLGWHFECCKQHIELSEAGVALSI